MSYTSPLDRTDLTPKGWPYISPGWSECEPQRTFAQPWVVGRKIHRPRNHLCMHAAVCRGRHMPRAIIGLGWPPLATTRWARPLIHDDGDPGLRNVRFTHVAPPWAEIRSPLRGLHGERSGGYRVARRSLHSRCAGWAALSAPLWARWGEMVATPSLLSRLVYNNEGNAPGCR